MIPSTTSPSQARLSRLARVFRSACLALVTPLLEKNPIKTGTANALDIPVVFSMSRLVVLAFAVAMIRQIWLVGIAAWPDATLSIAVVLAIPIVGAMERSRPGDVLELAKALVGRFGIGETRQFASIYATEPSKYDDHRDDDDGGAAGQGRATGHPSL